MDCFNFHTLKSQATVRKPLFSATLKYFLISEVFVFIVQDK